MVDEDRTTVRTYVPAYQKEEWNKHADELDMSLSEFVRTMVQAGRRGFGPDKNPDESDPGDETPGEDDLEDHLLDLLAREDHHTWEELVNGLTSDIEDRLDETLDRLQHENRVRYSGRRGGYTLVGDE